MRNRRFAPSLSALEPRLALDGAPDALPDPAPPPPTPADTAAAAPTGLFGPDGLPVFYEPGPDWIPVSPLLPGLPLNTAVALTVEAGQDLTPISMPAVLLDPGDDPALDLPVPGLDALDPAPPEPPPEPPPPPWYQPIIDALDYLTPSDLSFWVGVGG